MQKEFIRELRFAYNHLYEWAALRKSPLVKILGLENKEDSSNSLGNILREAIEAIKPQGEKNLKLKSWRVYQLLYVRYIEQLSQYESAADLGLSLRHLRREETLALETVGLYLWDHYQLEKKWRNLPPETPTQEHNPPAEIITPDRYSELAWLRQSIPYELVRIQDLLHEIMTMTEAALRKKTIQIEFNLSESLPPVTTKRTTIRQALLSIVNHIIPTLPSGGTLEFSAEVTPSQLALVIEGWGNAGINLVPFSEEERVTVLRQLIELSGGTLSINTKGRNKSKFVTIISLPVKNMIKVMVVDDNRDTLQFIARCLTGTQYLLIPVSEPEKAIEIASTNLPQVIILDVMLPRIDGWELLGHFQNHPVLKDIPVVIYSILPQDQMANDLGAMAFLRKPVSRDDLLAFLDQNSNHFLER